MKTKQKELFEAINNNSNLEQIAQIIDQGADVNSLFSINSSLVMAVRQGNYELTEFLLQRNAEINSTSSVETALIASIWSPNPAIFDLLVANGADVNQQDNGGMGPLVYAINSGKKDIIKTILEHKDINVNPITNSQTPLTAAAMLINEDTDLVKTLLKMGAEVNPVTNNQTPLAAAAMMGNLATVELLLEHNAEVNPIITNSQTPLAIAAMRGDINIVKILLAQGAEVNPVGVFQTPLISAIQSGRGEIFDLLIEYKADVNLKTNTNETPLVAAMSNIKYDMAIKLIHLEADVKGAFSSQNGYNFLSNLIWNPSAELLKLVLKKGVDVNTKNSFNGQTILDMALQNGNHEMAEILKEYGAEAGVVPEQSALILSEQVALSDQAQTGYQTLELSNIQKLFQAVYARDFEKVKEIVSYEGAWIVNDKSNVQSVLFAAVSNAAISNIVSHCDSVKILDYLLDLEGVDINIKHYKTSLLQHALELQNHRAVEKLIKLGAEAVILEKDYLVRPENKLFIDYICNQNEKVSNFLRDLEGDVVDPVSILSSLKSIIRDGHRATLQTVVTKGGNALLKLINDNHKFKEIKKDFTKYGIKYSAKYKADEYDFIITSTFHQDESDKLPYNNPEVKEKSKTFFKDGKIYSAKTGKILDEINGACYVISKTGKLYTNIDGSNQGHHSFFLKGKPGDELFGYGKPVACGGHLSIKDGKITEFSGTSGHYCPTVDQIKVVAHYLKYKGVLAENNKIEWYDQNAGHGLFNEVTSEMIGQILDQYAEVNY